MKRALVIAALLFATPALAEEPRVFVVKTADAPVIAELAAGFRSAFPNAVLEEILLTDASETGLAKKLAGGAAILSVGPKAATVVAKLKLGVPSIACVPASAADPANQGSTLRLQPPVDGVMAAVAWMGAYKKIGFVVDASQRERLELAKAAGAARQLQVIAAPVATARDVVTAVQGLLGTVDVLVVDVTDGLSLQDVQFILKAAADQKTPVVGTSEGFLKNGAPAAVAIDPRNVGAEAGRLAAAKASGLFDPRRFRVLVNLVATQRLGMTVPQDRGIVENNILTLDTDGTDLSKGAAGGKPSNDNRPVVLKQSRLVFPPIAMNSGVRAAEVVLEVLVKTDGTVGESKVLKGDPMFTVAAKDSVKDWQFKPATRDGAPVEGTLRLNLKFQR